MTKALVPRKTNFTNKLILSSAFEVTNPRYQCFNNPSDMGLILKKIFLSMSISFILFSVYSVYIISVPGNIHAWAFSLSPLDLHASRNIRFYFSRNIRFYRSHISFIHEVLTKVRPCKKKIPKIGTQ